jgi:hypothetical protein
LKKSGAKNFYYFGPEAGRCQRPDPEYKSFFGSFCSQKELLPSFKPQTIFVRYIRLG